MQMKKCLMLAFILSLCLHLGAEGVFSLNVSKEEMNHISVSKMFTKSDTISFLSRGIISGLCINGSFEKKSDDYLIRVILVDKEKHEHLVMESYDMLNSDFKVTMNDYCEETAFLEDVTPDYIKVIAKDAELVIDNIGYTSFPKGSRRVGDQARRKANVMKEQKNSIFKRINAYNASHGRPWIAGNTGLSNKCYEVKKRLLGFPDDASTYGYEYYSDGFFIMGNRSGNRSTISSDYVSSFDWRNRHGKNWLTPVKDQKGSNYCFAFATTACLESMYKLYFNNNTNIDLSEQEAACCSYSNYRNTFTDGGHVDTVFNYMQNHGICDEYAYPFDSTSYQPCFSDTVTSNEIVSISGRSKLMHNEYDDSIKNWLINYGPLVSGYWWPASDMGHAMLMVGYDTIRFNDIIRIHHSFGLGDPQPMSYNMVGRTYWKFKNSMGGDSDSPLQGYQYIVFDNNYYMKRIYHIQTPIISSKKFDTNIICEDFDGDGYYFWGISPTKPAWCPSWVPDIPDGDDSDPSKGDLYTNATSSHLIGELRDLTYNETHVLSLPGDQSLLTRQSYGISIEITSGSTFTVYDILNMLGRVTITIQSGGHLIVDGGVITNVNLNMASGSKLTLRNNGKLVMRTNTDFYAPVGALVDIESGEIIRSNDF